MILDSLEGSVYMSPMMRTSESFPYMRRRDGDGYGQPRGMGRGGGAFLLSYRNFETEMSCAQDDSEVILVVQE